MELPNPPVPVPLVVIVVKNTVGDGLVLQQIPRLNTVEPPSLVILPPLLALAKMVPEILAAVMPDIFVVVSVGIVSVLKFTAGL